MIEPLTSATRRFLPPGPGRPSPKPPEDPGPGPQEPIADGLPPDPGAALRPAERDHSADPWKPDKDRYPPLPDRFELNSRIQFPRRVALVRIRPHSAPSGAAGSASAASARGSFPFRTAHPPLAAPAKPAAPDGGAKPDRNPSPAPPGVRPGKSRQTTDVPRIERLNDAVRPRRRRPLGNLYT